MRSYGPGMNASGASLSVIGQDGMAPIILRPIALSANALGGITGALIEPAITSRFWFSKRRGCLEPGKHVRWDWGDVRRVRRS